MEILKISETMYAIRHTNISISFPKEKFEDLYYAVPTSTTNFLRLLQDNVCANTQERLKLNEILQSLEDRIQALEQLQKQIQQIKL